MSDQSNARTVRQRTRPAPSLPPNQQILPPDLSSLFPIPLIPGEDAQAYGALLSQVTAAVKPTDAIEELWVRDVVDLAWESHRLRRLKANLLVVARKRALQRLLEAIEDSSLATLESSSWNQQLASRWLVKNENALAEVEGILNARGLDTNSIMAQALSDKLKQIEQVDRMIAGADGRRNKVLTEIERRRESVARRLRMATDAIIDVDDR
jgi:hypothetical protein